MPIKISGIILASGFSSRMGCNKLLLPWPCPPAHEPSISLPLLQYVVDTAKQSRLDEVLVVLPEQGTEAGDALRQVVDFSDCKVLENPLRSLGQAEALKVGIQHVLMHSAHVCTDAQEHMQEDLQESMHGAMILLGDQPFLQPQTLDTLITAAQENPQSWILPVQESAMTSSQEKVFRQGNPVIIPSVEFSRVLQLEGDTGARVLHKNSLFPKVYVPIAEQGPFIDIDTKEMYEKYKVS